MSDKLVDNVRQFFDKAGRVVGRAAADNFTGNTWHEITGDVLPIDGSPIEQLFYIAFKAIRETADINWEAACKHGAGWEVDIEPQWSVGTYRADFKMQLVNYEICETKDEVLIELDGHKFHDKDETQRRYEKKRDRYLQSQGYRVLHFTGKEVTDDPYRVAQEAIALLLELDADHLSPVNYLED